MSPAWRQANAGHVSLDQLKVMSAIENCRTAALGGQAEADFTTFCVPTSCQTSLSTRRAI
jgi:hypothetical protein